MRLALFTLITTLTTSLFSQSIDISGTWIGSSTFVKGHTQLKFVLTQNGNKVTGEVEAKAENSGDQIVYTVSGTIQGSKVDLIPVEIVEKSGFACMSKSNLNYKLNNGQLTLTGRWKGDAKLNTCPPFTSGSVTLIKEKLAEKIVATQRPVETTKSVANSDAIGQALINELSKRKYYALIIGVNEYQDDRIENLDNPLNDAKRLAEALTYHYSFEQENITLLENPKRADIIVALDNLTKRVKEKDNLLIFYAGHGIWNAQLNQGYWLPRDASLDSKSYWLSNSTLRDYVGGIKSKHTLLVSDACFSGGILKERAVFDNSRAILEMYKLPSRKAMTSGTLKTVPDQSVFMKYLLKNLISNQDPLLSADQLFRTFKVAVINNSPNGQVPQYGPISQAGDEGGDFIFLKRAKE
ncbi:MAG: caspase family protein [Bacteroidota bacterium]